MQMRNLGNSVGCSGGGHSQAPSRSHYYSSHGIIQGYIFPNFSNKIHQPRTQPILFKKTHIIHLVRLRSLSTQIDLLTKHKMRGVTILTFTKCDCNVPIITPCKRVPAIRVSKYCPVYKQTVERREGDCG